MRGYLGYVFRGREGLRSYAAFMGAALGGLFVLHLFILIVLVKDDYFDHIDLMFYEGLGSLFAGAFFGIVTERLMKLSAFGGVSRRSFIIGTGVAGLLFAALTSAAIQVMYIITELVYRLFGMGLDCMVMSGIGTHRSEVAIAPRTIIFNAAVTFFGIMLIYGFSVLFVGLRSRLRRAAPVITGAVVVFFGYSYDMYAGPLGELFGMLEDRLMFSEYAVAPEIFGTAASVNGISMTFGDGVLAFVVSGVLIFAVMYAVFALAVMRAPLRGRG